MASEIIIYQTEDQQTRIEVKLDGDTVWLTQKQLAQLFNKTVPTINEHIQNVFEEGELEREASIRNFRIVQNEATIRESLIVQNETPRQVSRMVAHYNLDLIISVGYRVKSLQGTKFRIWATKRLKEFLVKGFTLDDERLKEGRVPAHYYNELVERIREIRISERNFHSQLLALFATAADYDPKSEAAGFFFAHVQNKLHWAVHKHTAAELIAERADANKPNMGLKTWKGKKPRPSDAGVAKNYLDENELQVMKLLISQYLDFAELQARTHHTMYMRDWAKKLDAFIQLNERDLLKGAGKISAEMAKELAEREFGKFEDESKFEISELSVAVNI